MFMPVIQVFSSIEIESSTCHEIWALLRPIVASLKPPSSSFFTKSCALVLAQTQNLMLKFHRSLKLNSIEHNSCLGKLSCEAPNDNLIRSLRFPVGTVPKTPRILPDGPYVSR